METISQREFARKIGCSEAMIRKAIRTGKIKKGVTTDEKGNPRIIEAVATAEWKQNYNAQFGVRNENITATIGDDSVASVVGEAKGTASDLNRAKLAKAVVDAKIAQLDLAERTGELVRKDAVYKALFAFGQQIRDAFQAIPSRITGDIIAAGSNRVEAQNILSKEIADVLEKLSNMKDIKIS